jgi:hypothetical protein
LLLERYPDDFPLSFPLLLLLLLPPSLELETPGTASPSCRCLLHSLMPRTVLVTFAPHMHAHYDYEQDLINGTHRLKTRKKEMEDSLYDTAHWCCCADLIVFHCTISKFSRQCIAR